MFYHIVVIKISRKVEIFMKKINYKSRKGFTLIELLVVIGILAVLAAIAIPSVAGLIDRANQSADNTNANEMNKFFMIQILLMLIIFLV